MPRRPARPSRREALLVPAITFGLLAIRCNAVPYDFTGEDEDTWGPGLTCADLAPIEARCAAPPEVFGGCLGHASVATETTAQTMGCTPAGQALAAVRGLAPSGETAMDIYAWIEATAPSPSPTISLFADLCGEQPFGPDNQCDYRSWLFRSKLEAAAGFTLHVQSNEPTEARLGYQLMAPNAWLPSPPDHDTAMTCSPSAGAYVDEALLYPNPVEGEIAAISFFDRAPVVGRTPRICGDGALGWREAVFLLRNPLDSSVHVTGIGLSSPAPESDLLAFNYALFRCANDATVAADHVPEAQRCGHGEVAGPVPTDMEIVEWDGSFATEYLLVVQVPPWVSSTADLSLIVEPD